MKKFMACISISYALLLLYWMFLGFGRSHRIEMGYSYNLVPFHTLKIYFLYADHFKLRVWLINIVGNVAVFAPFGITVPYLLPIKFIRFTLLFIMVLFLLESLQLLLRRGSFDVDDVLLNTLGASIGFLMYEAWKRWK